VLIELNERFDLRMTVRSHGWVNLEPFQWLSENSVLTWPARIDGISATVAVSQVGPKALEVVTTAHTHDDALEQHLRHVLMLDWDAAEALRIARECDERVAALVEAGGGRLLRAASPFEDVVKTVCTINTSWRNTQAMVRGLVSLSEAGVFPTPDLIMRLGADRLRDRVPVGYRAETIVAVAELAVKADLARIDLERLAQIRGLGPYAMAHIAVLRGDYSTIPVDSEVRAYCSRHLGIHEPNADTIHRHFAAWGRYRFLGFKLGRMARSENWIGD